MKHAAGFVARELLAYALHGALTPILRTGKRVPGHGPVVLFIHGHGGGPGAFLPLARALAARGFRSVASFGYFSVGTIDKIAGKLRRYVDEELGGEPPLVVAHSLGGIIARCWLQELGGRAQALVTLSTPHGGLAPVPGLALVPLIRELHPDGELVGRLKRTAEHLGDMPRLSVVSTRDHFVRPAARAEIPGARLVAVEDLGHVGLLYAPRIQALVGDFLADAAGRR